MILRNQTIVLMLFVFSIAFSGCQSKASGDGVPTAYFTVTPKPDGVTFLFDATNSSDPDGQDLIVEWNFGDDGEIVDCEGGPCKINEYGLIEYTYAVTDATMMVSLVVRDPDGHSSFQLEPVAIGTGTNNGAEIKSKNTTRWVKPDSNVVLDASKSTDPEGDLFSYEWFFGPFDAQVANRTLDTGLLAENASFDITFDTIGVYQMHCHPHPWMQSRVVVSDTDPNATDTASVDIRSFAYSQKTVTLKPGGTIHYTNKDPVEHTAKQAWFAPGKAISTSPVFSQKLPAGDFQALLFTNDGKGGFATATWGLKASADAPENPLVKDLANETALKDDPPILPTDMDPTFEYPYKVDWVQNLTVSLSGSDAACAAACQVTWNTHLLDKNKQKIAEGFCEDGTCTFVINLQPGEYTVVAEAHASAPTPQVSAAWTLTATQYTKPTFGDSGSGACLPPKHFHAGMCH